MVRIRSRQVFRCCHISGFNNFFRHLEGFVVILLMAVTYNSGSSMVTLVEKTILIKFADHLMRAAFMLRESVSSLVFSHNASN